MPNEKGTVVYAMQKKFQGVFGFTLPLFHGRGMLNCELTRFGSEEIERLFIGG